MNNFLLGIAFASSIFLYVIWILYCHFMDCLHAASLPKSKFNDKIHMEAVMIELCNSKPLKLPIEANTLDSLKALAKHNHALAILENGRLIFEDEIIDFQKISIEIEGLLTKAYLDLDAASHALVDLSTAHYSMMELGKSNHIILQKISGISNHYPMEWTICDVCSMLGINPSKNETGAIGGDALWDKVRKWQCSGIR